MAIDWTDEELTPAASAHCGATAVTVFPVTLEDGLELEGNVMESTLAFRVDTDPRTNLSSAKLARAAQLLAELLESE